MWGREAGVVEIDYEQSMTNPIIRLKERVSVDGSPVLNSAINEQLTRAPQSSAEPVNTFARTDVIKSPAFAPRTALEALPKKRSDQFQAILRLAQLGPFAKVRWAVYDAIEEHVRQSQAPANIMVIVQQAVASVKSKDTRDSKYPWWPTQQFILKMLNEEPVAMDEKGNVIKPSQLSGLHTAVAGFKPNWREILDGRLLLHLIEVDDSVTFENANDLTAVLYDSRSDAQMTDRLVRVFKLLETSGQIKLDPDGKTFRSVRRISKESGLHADGTGFGAAA
jgi:hypothetical protein